MHRVRQVRRIRRIRVRICQIRVLKIAVNFSIFYLIFFLSSLKIVVPNRKVVPSSVPKIKRWKR